MKFSKALLFCLVAVAAVAAEDEVTCPEKYEKSENDCFRRVDKMMQVCLFFVSL